MEIYENQGWEHRETSILTPDIWKPIDTMTETFSKIKGNILEKSDPFDKKVEKKLLKFGNILDLLSGNFGQAIHEAMIAHLDKNKMGRVERVEYLRNGCKLYVDALGDKLKEIEEDWLPNLNYPHEICTKNGKENCEVPKTWGSFVLCKSVLAYNDNKVNNLFLGTMAGLHKQQKGASE